MKRACRTALGIDISGGRIHLALLKRSGDGVKLVKAASCPVPDGAIEDGNIADAGLLAGAIKRLKIRNWMHSQRAAMSLVAEPTLVQILDIPGDRASSVRSFVLDEVKHYAVLPMGGAVVDFWGIETSGRPGQRRALVVAADGQKTADAVYTFAKRGLNVDAIEPGWAAYVRAFYDREIRDAFGTNLLFAIVHNGTATLCLFRDGILDFVRTKRIEGEVAADYLDWLAEEIDAIVRFYEYEVSDKACEWKVTLVTDACDEPGDERAERLKSKLSRVELEVRTICDWNVDASAGKRRRGTAPSSVAVGLAMKLLACSGGGPRINLLPPQVTQARWMENQILVGANAAAIVFLLMVLVVGILNMKVEGVNGRIERHKRTLAGKDIGAMKDEQVALAGEIARMSGRLEGMKAALGAGVWMDWEGVLDEISLATPQNVQLTELSSPEGSKITLLGQALSHDGLRLFVEKLNGCEHVESASLVRADKAEAPGGLIRYIVTCSLIEKKRI